MWLMCIGKEGKLPCSHCQFCDDCAKIENELEKINEAKEKEMGDDCIIMCFDGR